MGYACPVCDVPQRDAEHLANHLAFTAMLHGDEHESWLDDRVPGWSSSNPADLGPRVAELAPETAYDEAFEDTVARHAGHDRGGSLFDDDAESTLGVDPSAGAGGGAPDEETRAVLAEAREMTRRMREGRAVDDSDADDESA
jgi:hypothetical protein